MESLDADNLRDGLVRGDREAFAQLYARVADRLHHYLTVLLLSRDAADDVLQETFVRLAEARAKLSEVENVVGYLFRIARNEAWRRLRRRSPRTDHVAAEMMFHVAENGDPQADHEASEWIATALARLAGGKREVVELKVFGGLTFREIAHVTRRPQGTVATQYRAAILELRTLLKEEDEPCPNRSKDA